MRNSLTAPSQSVDCGTCAAPRSRCADCMVTALAHLPVPGDGDLPLDAAEARAVHGLLSAGLITSACAAGASARRERLTRWAATG